MLRGSNIRITQGGTYDSSSKTITGGELVALCTSCKISCTTNTEDTAVKTDASHVAVAEADWDTPSISSKSWNVSVDKLYDKTGTLFTADKTVFLADTKVMISFTIGSTLFYGECILSGNQVSGQNKQNATSSLTFTGDGALAYAQ